MYYYGARYYDARVSVWMSTDPMMYQHPNYTPYAYVYNNPIALTDPVGMDSTQRANAIAQARRYVAQKAPGNQYAFGSKKGPGNPVDCSGVVSNCVMAGGERDPNRGGAGSGVLNIEANTTRVSDSDAVPGNIVTFRSSKGYPYHTGLLTGITRDGEGRITNITFIHSSGGIGPNEASLSMDDLGKLSVYGYYKWDTKPDPVPAKTVNPVSATANISAQTPAVPNYEPRSNSIFEGLEKSWSNFKYEVMSGISRAENWIKTGYR